jgi:hypothetical protein
LYNLPFPISLPFLLLLGMDLMFSFAPISLQSSLK